MLALSTRSTPHFTHQFPGHILEEVHAETEYQCDACKTDGDGTRFQCNNCDYHMHDYCAMCPSTVSSFMHPQHPLTLAITPTHRICNLCNEGVEGLFLWCQYCDFNIHPLCTLLPPQLHHVLDQAHPLTLQASVPPGWCAVCRGECHSWRYRCGLCNFDIHMGCVSVPCGLIGQPNSPALTQERKIPTYAGYGFNYGVDPNCQPPPPVLPHYGANGYGYINPYYYNYLHQHHHHHPLPPYGDHNGCFCVPPAASNNIIQPPQDNYYMYNYGNNLQVQSQGQGQVQGSGPGGSATNNGGYGKKMFGIIKQLAMGVVSNIIFGLISS